MHTFMHWGLLWNIAQLKFAISFTFLSLSIHIEALSALLLYVCEIFSPNYYCSYRNINFAKIICLWN